ncbi:MAG: alcohol dehydrogenase catalytic domain-containing protein, partial [Chloroflexota bacterium]
MTVRAMVLRGDGGSPELSEFADPALEDGAVLLETMASEVCGTDVHLRHGRLAGVPYPIIPGHVSVGRVLTVRGIVRDVEGDEMRPGELVTFLDVHRTCG